MSKFRGSRYSFSRILWKKRRTRRKRRTPQIGLNKLKNIVTRCKRRIRRNATFVDSVTLT